MERKRWIRSCHSFCKRLNTLTVPNFRYFQSIFAIPFYLYFLLSNSFDLVNVFYAGYGEAQSIRLSKKLKRYTLVFIAGYPIEQVPHRFEEFRELGLEKELDFIIAKSSSMVEAIQTFFGKKVFLLPNGIDEEYFSPPNASTDGLVLKLNIPNSAKILLTVAAFEERKGIQYVIKALPELNRAEEIHYVIVGEGEYGDFLEAVAADIGVSDLVHFVGSVLDVRSYYEIADLFVLLSSGEGFPNVVLEAWLMGLPTIVSKHPPYPEIITQNLGTLVDEKTTNELIVAISYWLDQMDNKPNYGIKIRNCAILEYGLTSFGQKYLNIIDHKQPLL